MAFPQVAATNSSTEGSNTSTHTVSLPIGIEAGNLLLVFFVCDNDAYCDDVSFPDGWTEIKDIESGGGIACRLAVAWKEAEGDEGEIPRFL